MTYNRDALKELLRAQALSLGEFTLASGKKSHYYLDCRRVTLSAQGAVLIAQGMLEALSANMPDAVGGLAIGADPITAALLTVAGLQGKELRGFIVRKEPKAHGKGRQVEGPVAAGDRVVIVEDVVTTGGSALVALQHAREMGLEVQGVLAIIDRLEGGAAAFEQEGVPLTTLFTIRDFGIEPLA